MSSSKVTEAQQEYLHSLKVPDKEEELLQRPIE